MNEYSLDLLETKIKRIKELEEENKKLAKQINEDIYKPRIDKAIKLLEEDYFEDGSGNNVEEVIKILKGEE